MPNLEVRAKTDLSSFRKIALGTWKTARDPSVYGSMDIEVDEALRYIEEFRAKTGRRLTITHMMARAMGATLAKMPDANAILRFGRIYVRKRIGVFFQVAMEDEKTGEIDLSGATVHDPEQKTLMEILDDFDSQVKKVRKGEDEKLEQSRSLMKSLPWFLVRWMLDLMSFLGYTLNINMEWAGVPKDAFGSAMITNIGSLGLQEAYVPLVPYSRVPLLLALGEMKQHAVVKDGKIVPATLLHMSATFDHRVLDGVHASVMAKTMRKWIENPFEHFDDIDSLPSAEDAKAIEAPAEDGADASA